VGARATLSAGHVAVVPGSEASIEVRVRNNGAVVDEFRIEVVGEAAGWATAVPASLNLFPGAEGTSTITFRPPASADVVAGAVPFGVRVVSREDASGSVTEEGTVEVQPLVSVGIDVTPRTSRGRRQMAHEVAVNNHGNSPVAVELVASDPDQHLAFDLSPSSVTVGPGEAVFAKLRIRPTTKHGSGPPLTRPFQVVAAAPGGEPYAAAQAMAVQDPIRPPWLRRAVMWTILGLVGLAALWFALLKPTVESAAREAVKEDDTPVTIGPGGGGSGGGGSGSGSGSSGSGSDSGSGSTDGAGGVVGSQPIDGRLFLTSSGSTDFTVPDGQVLQLTDIVLQNPSGNTGSLRIQRGDTPLLVVELANFRDLDYHFVAPIVFTGGQKLVLAADCTSPGCNPGAYFAGFISK